MKIASRFDYLYILLTIGFTIYGQIVLKWRISSFGSMPLELLHKLQFLLLLFLDPWILSGFFSGFLASLAWMAAMTRFDLSHGYPFMSLNFAIVLLLSGWLLNEPISVQKILGIGLIMLGTLVAARG